MTDISDSVSSSAATSVAHTASVADRGGDVTSQFTHIHTDSDIYPNTHIEPVPTSIWLGLVRIPYLIWHIVRGLWLVYVCFGRMDAAGRQRTVQQWAQSVVRSCGLQVHVHGTAAAAQPHKGVLLVSNHISWADIPVLHSQRFCRFIAKSEVRTWPLLGRLAASADTVWIDRSSRQDAQRVRGILTQRLLAGDVLAVFPEGTTSDGRQLLPFRAGLLQAAIDGDAPIQPVALRFADVHGQPSLLPCYVGDDTLVQSLWRTLCARGLVVHVHWGEVQYADGRTRQNWAQDLHAAVDALRQGHQEHQAHMVATP